MQHFGHVEWLRSEGTLQNIQFQVPALYRVAIQQLRLSRAPSSLALSKLSECAVGVPSQGMLKCQPVPVNIHNLHVW